MTVDLLLVEDVVHTLERDLSIPYIVRPTL